MRSLRSAVRRTMTPGSPWTGSVRCSTWLPRVAAYTKRHPDLAGPLTLRCTDRPELWLLAPCPDTAPKITGPHLGGAPHPGAGGQAVAEIRGDAVDLLLALWKRLDLDQLTVEGDADVARRFLASALTP
ncbi:hypothetical protein ABN034_31680 [Actinopolymorpha sp. B11F2]|uniref:hypothetical protein n=1 Tax=Actinopolymorpha sp. B11F2 TaxID=3160862 RepID=UPI0032E3EA99